MCTLPDLNPSTLLRILLQNLIINSCHSGWKKMPSLSVYFPFPIKVTCQSQYFFPKKKKGGWEGLILPYLIN